MTDIVLKSNAPLVRKKKPELIDNVPKDLPATFADENRLQQIFYNLVGNGIKFTETGYVKIGAMHKDGLLQISVEDTGTGIPENKRDIIFQEFEQGDGSISREFAGTGLGLSISKRMVELHGGRMWVESLKNQPVWQNRAFLAYPLLNRVFIRGQHSPSYPLTILLLRKILFAFNVASRIERLTKYYGTSILLNKETLSKLFGWLLSLRLIDRYVRERLT